MSRRPALYITADAPNARALIRGPEARAALEALGLRRQFSPSTRGWVIALSDVGDVLCYAEHYHLLAINHERKGEPT